MTRALPPRVPADLLAVLGESDLEAGAGARHAYPLLTVRKDGWPHIALLSVGEIFAVDETTLRIAAWRESTSSANLTASGKGTLLAVVGGDCYYLLVAATRLPDLSLPGGIELASFKLSVEEARIDVVPYATIQTGIRFRLESPEQVLPRWRLVRTALARGPSGS